MENFGRANYGATKYGKNLVVYSSRVHNGRIYEFCYSSKRQLKDNTINYYFQCVTCLKLKKDEAAVFGAKCVPKITITNDFIMTNPDGPSNGAHFCNGKSMGKSLAVQIDRDARIETKRGIKRPHQAYEDAESSIQRRLSK